jgi:hypothetical protein
MHTLSNTTRARKLPQSSKIVVLKALKSVADKWQTHVRLLVTKLTISRGGRSSCSQVGSIIRLVNLVNREVGRVNVRGEFGLEGCPDAAKSVEFNSTEELVVLDLIRTTTAKADLCIANKAIARD